MKKTFYKSIKTLCTTTIVAGLLLTNSTSQAAPLNLTQVFPDVFIDSLDIGFTFDGDGGQLTISGDPNSLTSSSGGQVNPIFAPAAPAPTDSFSLIADIDGAGNVLSGTVAITGNVHDALNLTTILFSGNLLNGDLDLFGFSETSPATGIIEFTFDNVSGVISDTFGPFSSGGIIISVTSSDLADFDTQLLARNWTGEGVADTFVPVPAAIWLFGSGLIGLLVTSRKKNS